ncbi:MAG: hypothetical protein RBT63_01845, partial [Bdellovibrionales bacterium]|jgi:hypothetical protein|nr:hypothetical protein [Bdellovibrionales bacterium]
LPDLIQSEVTSCFRKEVDVRTGKVFASLDEYQKALSDWRAMSVPSVGLFDLATAYSVYRSSREAAAGLRSDKVAHCHVGCLIGLATSLKVVDYVGWLKEERDLTDCTTATLFEEDDFVATSRGARLGARDEAECVSLCRTEYARRRR